jgi:hypothetical protein
LYEKFSAENARARVHQMAANLRRTEDTGKLQQGGAGAGRAFINKVGSMEKTLDQQLEQFTSENPDVSKDDISKVKGLFAIFDRDMNGALDVVELTAMYEKLGKPKNNLDVKKEIAKYDKNNNGSINLYEYLQMTLGSTSSPFLKTLLFFKRLELENQAAAEKAANPRAAFEKERAAK